MMISIDWWFIKNSPGNQGVFYKRLYYQTNSFAKFNSK
jgi:hypothetical protein